MVTIASFASRLLALGRPSASTEDHACLPGVPRYRRRIGRPLPPGLKPSPSTPLPRWEGSSDKLCLSPVLSWQPVRATYLASIPRAPAPVVSHSPFVPPAMVTHLMRHKKDSAIGVKFAAGAGDTITLMEGAMHTFVTPIVRVLMHGDYQWRSGHHLQPFSDYAGKQVARPVVLSAAVHPDFETGLVMQKLAVLGDEPFYGRAVKGAFPFLSPDDKQNPIKRTVYDARLRQHMVAHLVRSGSLPGREQAQSTTLPYGDAVTFVEGIIGDARSPRNALCNIFVHGRRRIVLSLELLFNSYVQQARNELSALEQTCPQGYVYTFDPPAIFAQHLGAQLLNRLQIAAWRTLSDETIFNNMRVMAFNDYSDHDVLPLLRRAFANQLHVAVVAKAALFTGPNGTYAPPEAGRGALLVVHNNSDAFGQNIETEPAGGSMDGAIGYGSSAAASLHREHPRLTDHLF